MKKTMYGLMFLALTGTVMVGCQQEEADSPTPTSEIAVKESGVNNKANGRRTFIVGEGWVGCDLSAWDCLPTVEVEGYGQIPFDGIPNLSTMDDVFDDVEFGTSSSIITSFTDHRQVLIDFVPTDLVDGVIDGTYTVEMKDYNSDHERFLLFYPSGSSTLHLAVPLTD